MPNSLRCKIKHLCHNGTLTERERDRILKALELISDNATNGDVIKVLFPNDCVKQENGDKIVFSFIKAAGTIIIDADWWNAPYKKE